MYTFASDYVFNQGVLMGNYLFFLLNIDMLDILFKYFLIEIKNILTLFTKINNQKT